MIDIGLSKLALVAGVVLVVVGPDKLPRVARMAGSLLGRAQRYIGDVKREVAGQLELEELLKLEKDAHDAALGFGRSLEQDLRAGVSGSVLAEPSTDGSANALSELAAVAVPTAAQLASSVRAFRRKRLVQASAVPAWYKRKHPNGRFSGKHAVKTSVLSCAGRIGLHRSTAKATAFTFR